MFTSLFLLFWFFKHPTKLGNNMSSHRVFILKQEDFINTGADLEAKDKVSKAMWRSANY